MTEILRTIARRLADGGVESAQAEARTLVAHVAGVPLNQVDLLDSLEPPAADQLDALVKRRLLGQPLQHLTGWAHFRSVRLAVGPGVFIPRPETEVMTGWVIDWLTQQLKDKQRQDSQPEDRQFPDQQFPSRGDGFLQSDRLRVVELGAGSGAISLALAVELAEQWPALQPVAGTNQPAQSPTEAPSRQAVGQAGPVLVQWAVENSTEALRWMHQNLFDTAIQVVVADLAAALPELNGTVDVVIANPPYIPQAHWQELPREVCDHDPKVALVAGPDGLDVIRGVVQTARRLLRPGGLVACEHDDSQGQSAPALFQAAGFEDVTDHQDWNSRPRFVTAIRPNQPDIRRAD